MPIRESAGRTSSRPWRIRSARRRLASPRSAGEEHRGQQQRCASPEKSHRVDQLEEHRGPGQHAQPDPRPAISRLPARKVMPSHIARTPKYIAAEDQEEIAVGANPGPGGHIVRLGVGRAVAQTDERDLARGGYDDRHHQQPGEIAAAPNDPGAHGLRGSGRRGSAAAPRSRSAPPRRPPVPRTGPRGSGRTGDRAGSERSTSAR